MSPDVPATKVAATERWGAQVVNAPPSSEARRKLAEQLAAERGMVIVPPYDDLAIIAGQGTIGLELVEDLTLSMPTSVYVPIGGGGLISGVAAALKQTRPEAAWSRRARMTPFDRSARGASLRCPAQAAASPMPSRSSNWAI
jgi:threonine dehydratase